MIQLHRPCFCLLVLANLPNGLAAEPQGRATLSTAAAPSSFQVRNKKYGDLLRPEDANSANGTRIVLYPAHMWKCVTWRFHPAGEGTFQLQNHFTSKTFAPDIQGGKTPAPVIQVPFAKEVAARPSWVFTKLADGTFKIAESKSGKMLTAAKGDNGSGAKIIIAPWQEKDEQKWELIETDPKQLTM